MIRIVLLFLTIMTLPLRAEEVIGALSQNTIAITANFNGSEIFVYGAVKRSEPVPDDAGPLHVIITVKGPNQRVVVRKKERMFGIWANRDQVEVDEAPSFYAIATTDTLDDIISDVDRLRYRIGFDRAVRVVDPGDTIEMPRSFTQAVVRIRQDNGLYRQEDGIVQLRDETLFSTSVELPANLIEGDYEARMFLVRDRAVIHSEASTIAVRKAGLERLIYTTAHERPLLYGILSIAVALFAGWAASEIFRQLRR